MFKSGFLGERKQHATAGVNMLKIVSASVGSGSVRPILPQQFAYYRSNNCGRISYINLGGLCLCEDEFLWKKCLIYDFNCDDDGTIRVTHDS